MTVDLSAHTHPPLCEMECGNPGQIIAKGCGDTHPVILCRECFDRGVEVVNTYVRLWRQFNKRVMICGDCHRPIISLDTHLDAREITP